MRVCAVCLCCSKRGDTDSAAVVKKLPAKEVRHLFTELRKAANNPMLMRSHYSSDEKASFALDAFV